MSPSDLEDEQTLRAQHQEPDDDEQGEHLGHRSGEEELERRLRLRDGEGRGNRAEQALRAAEDDDQEGVDDVELAGGRIGRADHGEGRAGNAGDAAAETEGEPVDPPVLMPAAPLIVRLATTARTCRPQRERKSRSATRL